MRIETLPRKVRLSTTRANRGNMDDLKDNAKRYVKELEDDDNKKEDAERTSSVYGKTLFYFLSIDILYCQLFLLISVNYSYHLIFIFRCF